MVCTYQEQCPCSTMTLTTDNYDADLFLDNLFTNTFIKILYIKAPLSLGQLVFFFFLGICLKFKMELKIEMLAWSLTFTGL